jgi:hypothetical protein
MSDSTSVLEEEGEMEGRRGDAPSQVVGGADVEMNGSVLGHDLATALENTNDNREVRWRLLRKGSTVSKREARSEKE